VAGRCDDTVDKKRVNSCERKHIFLREFATKNIEKEKRIFFPDALLMSRFEKIATWRCPKKSNGASRGFHSFQINEFPNSLGATDSEKWFSSLVCV